MHLRRAGVALLCNVVVKENCGSNFILIFPFGHRDFNRDGHWDPQGRCRPYFCDTMTLAMQLYNLICYRTRTSNKF